MILLLVVIAIGSVVSLGWMAERYSSILDRSGSTDGEAASAMLGRFIQARLELLETIRSENLSFDSSQNSGVGAFAVLRQRALAKVGMDAADYREMRARYQSWREDRAVVLSPWREALEAQAAMLLTIDLGELEPLDR
jgi:hypothetical protein